MDIFKIIKDSVPLQEAYGLYDGRTLKHKGSRYYGQCTKHNDKTPSLVIYTDSDRGFCFGCQWGFDVIDYVADVFNISNVDACNKLAQDFGIMLPNNNMSKEEMQKASHQRQLEKELAASLEQKLNDFYHKCTVCFKTFQEAERECQESNIDYTDPFYRWIRYTVQFYDRITDDYINGDIEKQVNLMKSHKNEIYFKLKSVV